MPISAALPAPQQRQNLAGQLFGPNVGGFVGGLSVNPLFMGGLTTLMGQGPTAGAQIAQATQQGQMQQSEFERQQAERERMRRVWEAAFPGGQPNAEHPLLRGLPADVAGIVAAMGPEQALPALQKFALTRAVPPELQFKAVGEGGVIFNPRTGQVQRVAGVGGAGFTKPPAGYRWTEGGELEAIPGGPATSVSADVAGRLAMIETAQKDLPEARKVFEQSWGVTGTLGQAVVPEFMSEWSGRVGRARRTITSAIEAALRAMTGAAAPESEVRRYEDLFMPSVTDRPETVRQKLDALERFMASATEIATRGRRTGGAQQPAAGGERPSVTRYRYNPETGELE